jgi:hypothetical protein
VTDLYLRFDYEAAALAALPPADEAFLIDVLGVVRTPIQQWTDDGEQMTRRRRGWHVNIRCTDDRDLSAFEPFVVTPEQPAREWF